MDEESISPHFQVKFFTKQPQHSIPNTPYSVPAKIGITELSTLVNSILKPGGVEGQHIPFDFLVNGVFLRVTLEEYVTQHTISTETVIELEYLERRPAPEPEDSLQHDDWVSAIHALNDCILTGSYDNNIRVWNTEGEIQITIPGHSSPVKCVTWIHNEDENAVKTFLSGSHDETALLWEWNQQENNIKCVYMCRGHAGSVDCVAINPEKTRFCSGSWDKMLKIWSADLSPENDEGVIDSSGEAPAKKQKTDGSKIPTRVPIMTLSGHNEGVASAVWLSSNEVCTASWDHTIRLWDIEQAAEVHCLNGSKVVFSISFNRKTGLIISGSADRHVRLYDPRSKDGAIVKSSYTSHNAWISSVAWSACDENLFISGSYDNLVKLWDVRSPNAPLYDLKGHEDKVLAVDWSMPQYMMSGGADNALKLFKTNASISLMS